MIHELQVLVAHDLPLPIPNHLLLVLHHRCPLVVLLNVHLISKCAASLLLHLLLVLLVDELLRGLTELPLLVSIVLMEVGVLQTFGLLGAQHMITLTNLCMSLKVALLLFLLHRLLKFHAVTASLIDFLGGDGLLFPLVRLSLTLDDGAPLVESAASIRRVVALVVVGECVELFTLVL